MFLHQALILLIFNRLMRILYVPYSTIMSNNFFIDIKSYFLNTDSKQISCRHIRMSSFLDHLKFVLLGYLI